jgi:hypothetical protein
MKEEELGIENSVVQTWSMCSVLELDRDKDQMEFDGPESRAFRIALEVLEDRNNRIGGKCNIRVPCLPPIFENLIAAHVKDLLGRPASAKALSKSACQTYIPSNADRSI